MIIKSRKAAGTWQICAAGEEILVSLIKNFGIQVSSSSDEDGQGVDRKQVDDLARRETAAGRRVHRLEEQLAEANGLIDALTMSLDNHKTKLDSANAEIRGSIEDNEKLSAKLRQVEQRRVELEKKIAFLEQENTDLEGRLDKASARAVKAETALGAVGRTEGTVETMRALARRIDDQSKSAKTQDAALAMRICAKAIRDELTSKEQAA